MRDLEISINYDLSNLAPNAMLSLIFAPIVSASTSMVFLALVTVGCILVGCLYSVAVWGVGDRPDIQLERPFVSAMCSVEVRDAFCLSVWTTLLTLFILGWLGATGLIWLLESFFVILATLQIASATILSVSELVIQSKEIRDAE